MVKISPEWVTGPEQGKSSSRIALDFLKIIGILNNVFRSPKKTLKKTRIKLYNTLALPVMLYGS